MHTYPIRHPLRKWRRMILTFMVVVAAAMSALPHITYAGKGPVLANGNFEQGFQTQTSCAKGSGEQKRDVGVGWSCFTNDGAAHYGFYGDSWSPVVADGQYSQLIEINTWGVPNADNDRYAGIFQPVTVMPGGEYRLSLRGMIRTTNMEGDEWRYQVQVGYLENGDLNWRNVTNWRDVGWYTYYKRTEPGSFSEFKAIVKPKSDRITLFIRVWKKWGITDEELDVNLDMISLEKVEMPKPKK